MTLPNRNSTKKVNRAEIMAAIKCDHVTFHEA